MNGAPSVARATSLVPPGAGRTRPGPGGTGRPAASATASALGPASRYTASSAVRSARRARRGGTERVKIASARSRPSAGTVKLTVDPSLEVQASTTIMPLGVSSAPYTNAPSPGFSTSLVSRPWAALTAPGPVSATSPASTRARTAPVRRAASRTGETVPGARRATVAGAEVGSGGGASVIVRRARAVRQGRALRMKTTPGRRRPPRARQADDWW